jgi:hypothetical protein
MSDIERWTDEDAPDEIRELFSAARRESPRTRVLEKALVAVGVATAGTLATSAAAAAVPASNVVVVLKWGLGGVLSGLLVAGGASVVLERRSPRVEAPVAIASVEVRAAQPLASVPARQAAPARPAESAVATTTPSVRPSASFGASPVADRLMAEELAILDAARAAVDSKDAARALGELAKHERKFGATGRFLPEARYLKLEASLLSKDQKEARAAAQKILSQDPASPHARRAKSVLEQNP